MLNRPDHTRRRAHAQAVRASQLRRDLGISIGTFEYDGQTLTWLIRLGKLTEAEADLGQSVDRRKRRLFDLALRKAVTSALAELIDQS